MTIAIAPVAQNIPEAVRLLGVYTAGTYNVWDLSGSQKTSCRAHIMSQIIKGNNRPGVSHLLAVLFRVAGIKTRHREMDLEAEEKLIQWCKEIARGSFIQSPTEFKEYEYSCSSIKEASEIIKGLTGGQNL